MEKLTPRRRRRMQRVTMAEVAQAAAVSPSTVSLYLRKPGQVSPAIGARIAEVVEALGYVPSFVAGGLAAAGSRAVSVIVPTIQNDFFAGTIAALQAMLEPAGFQLLLGNTDYNPSREERLVRTALSWAPAAIVLVGLEHGRGTKRLLLGTPTPVFEIWECGGSPIDTAVGFHHREVGATALRHLAERGRRRLAFLGARMEEDRRARQRADGFTGAAAAAGLTPPLILGTRERASTEAGGRLLAEALAVPGRIDGIACSNDLMALGALFECQRRGINVPGALAVVGFGDLGFSASCVPPLTTIRPPSEAIGREVGRLIQERLGVAEPPDRPGTIDLGFKLVQRRSS
ncbi:LacI family DNA-binding transcriptional regulator [Muricoccus pecuniae]|uniref:LacI family gluconate utilization system Gnt-I transcriptional repressor n=1 Tax=Muricoccus pecuniae TaxID=693023 RepID=A0A840Y8K1_9PROT|nr:LacI family DNA-binding transcriptional regulator [Roseomonas pecuniae]MBB5696486.1 LacI family gluconate utilization system Gnt-I transcriptional repressor [Roseomonas pecuniae]